jgi:cobalt-zinc-cadmium efflux system outer membrane protein
MKIRNPTLLSLGAIPWLFLLSCGTSPERSDSKSAELVPPPPSAAVNYSVSGSAGPAELARQAVAHHPSIIAARHKAERLAAKVPQELSLPDPMAEIAAGSMAQTAAGQVLATGGIKQKIPFPGKRREAAAAAGSEAAAAVAEVSAMELKLTEQVHSAWWDLFLADQTLEITRESRSVLEAVRDSVAARVGADQAGQGDLLRVGNEVTLVDRDLADAQQLQNTARARLNSLLNRPAGASLPGARQTAIPSAGTLQELLARAQSRHPEVAAAEERANAFRHRLKRAELEKYPDLTAGVGGAAVSDSGLAPMANGRDQAFVTLGINIPLWQEPRRAMIREAREGIAETEALVASTRSDLRYRVEESWFRAKTARDISNLFETRLIPDSRQAYEVTLTGYSAGTSDFTGLLETWRQYLSYRLQLARNQAMLGKATATLRAAAAIQ